MSAVYQLSWSPYTNCPGGFNRYELSGSNGYSNAFYSHSDSGAEVVVNEGENVTFSLVAIDNYGQYSSPAQINFTADTNPGGGGGGGTPAAPDTPSGLTYSFVRFQ